MIQPQKKQKNPNKQVLGCINRSMKYKTWKTIVPPYLTLVRPNVEYCVQFWALHGCGKAGEGSDVNNKNDKGFEREAA